MKEAEGAAKSKPGQVTTVQVEYFFSKLGEERQMELLQKLASLAYIGDRFLAGLGVQEGEIHALLSVLKGNVGITSKGTIDVHPRLEEGIMDIIISILVKFTHWSGDMMYSDQRSTRNEA